MTPPRSTPRRSFQDSGRKRTRARDVRVYLVAFGISAVLHAVAIFLYPVMMARFAPEPDPGAVSPDEPARETVVVLHLDEVPAPDPSIPEVEEPEPETPETETPEVPIPADPLDEEAEEVEVLRPEALLPPAAERLRVPERGDARIWRPVDPALTELTPEQRALIHIYARLGAVADSMLADEEAARQTRDWTWTDEDGNRWGLSPGTLHLGESTVPIPFSFEGSAGLREEERFRQWMWDEVERGAESSLIRQTWRERAEAIRERRDAERADSTGVRR